jgi:hypothetical protein
VISPLPFRVIPCTEWRAAQPKGAISRVGKPVRTIFHHTLTLTHYRHPLLGRCLAYKAKVSGNVSFTY